MEGWEGGRKKRERKKGGIKKTKRQGEKEEKEEKNRAPESSLRRWHLSRNLFGPQEASGAELCSRGACAKALELFKEQTREPWLSLVGLGLNEMDEMSLPLAISRPQVQIPMGAQQEDEAGWEGMWPSGVYPLTGRLAATCAHGLDNAMSSLYERARIQIVVWMMLASNVETEERICRLNRECGLGPSVPMLDLVIMDYSGAHPLLPLGLSPSHRNSPLLRYLCSWPRDLIQVGAQPGGKGCVFLKRPWKKDSYSAPEKTHVFSEWQPVQAGLCALWPLPEGRFASWNFSVSAHGGISSGNIRHIYLQSPLWCWRLRSLTFFWGLWEGTSWVQLGHPCLQWGKLALSPQGESAANVSVSL